MENLFHYYAGSLNNLINFSLTSSENTEVNYVLSLLWWVNQFGYVFDDNFIKGGKQGLLFRFEWWFDWMRLRCCKINLQKNLNFLSVDARVDYGINLEQEII